MRGGGYIHEGLTFSSVKEAEKELKKVKTSYGLGSWLLMSLTAIIFLPPSVALYLIGKIGDIISNLIGISTGLITDVGSIGIHIPVITLLTAKDANRILKSVSLEKKIDRTIKELNKRDDRESEKLKNDLLKIKKQLHDYLAEEHNLKY